MLQRISSADSPTPGAILITGASSGLGAALAIEYAAPGRVLHLGGRDRTRLEDVAKTCRARGATVEALTCDVTDAVAMRRWIEAADDASPLTLVVANAGLGGAATLAGEAAQDGATVRTILDTNLGGAINTVLPILPRFRARRTGQIALVSSIAGLRGLPDAPAYSASKAGVLAYGEALRAQLAADGIAVSVVLPVVVDTPMSDGLRVPRLLTVAAPVAAACIRRGLAKGRRRIAVPYWQMLPIRLLALLPKSWIAALSTWLRARATQP